jgi:predicted house-cleaning noncanonical NTP pyrophosphatase (MazG superfamily)
LADTYIKAYGKIVRDKMRGIVMGGGFRTLTTEEKKQLLREKLIEEALEQNQANVLRDEIEELADVYAVLEELAESYYGGMKAVIEKAKAKEDERGGFKDGLYLIYALRTKKKDTPPQ